MTTFSVPDMSCGHCKIAIEKAIIAADPSAGISFDMATRKIAVNCSLTDEDLADLLLQEGYPSTVSP